MCVSISFSYIANGVGLSDFRREIKEEAAYQLFRTPIVFQKLCSVHSALVAPPQISGKPPSLLYLFPCALQLAERRCKNSIDAEIGPLRSGYSTQSFNVGEDSYVCETAFLRHHIRETETRISCRWNENTIRNFAARRRDNVIRELHKSELCQRIMKEWNTRTIRRYLYPSRTVPKAPWPVLVRPVSVSSYNYIRIYTCV